MLVQVVRFVFVLAGAVGGAYFNRYYNLPQPVPSYVGLILYIILGSGIGYIGGGVAGRRLIKTVDWIETKAKKTSGFELIIGVGGLITGLVIATLVSSPLRAAIEPAVSFVSPYVVILLYFLLGYLGYKLATRKKDDFAGAVSFLNKKRVVEDSTSPKKILDTSTIIDGRIADVCDSGFIEGRICIPRFILKELQGIADSEDVLKRNRGRRGLDILNRLQQDPNVEVEVLEEDYHKLVEVDSKLIKLAKDINGVIVTNDYNLNKVALLQDVKVLNINELAGALKPIVLPGEVLTVQLVKQGKEAGQGIGYLDDGTMIVVENGRRHLGKNLEVLVTSMLQTPAGRMIFAKIKTEVDTEASPKTVHGGK